MMKEQVKLTQKEQERDKVGAMANRDNLLMRTKEKRTVMGLEDPSDDAPLGKRTPKPFANSLESFSPTQQPIQPCKPSRKRLVKQRKHRQLCQQWQMLSKRRCRN
jgi:hypothetical protein